MKQEKIPFIKELYFDDISGKVMIHDSNNNDYECNIYGEKLNKFLPNITGFISAEGRKELKINKSLDNKDETKDLYHPQGPKFEGYFQFPNPLSVPFTNEKFAENTKKNLLKNIIR